MTRNETNQPNNANAGEGGWEPGPAPEARFSSRAGDYVRCRPSYPAEVIACLRDHCGLGADSTVADVGSGTGIFTALLLTTGCRVFAVEPNEAMRHAAGEQLGAEPGFHSIAAPAEDTGLASGSVDLITAAQAFHWFRREEAWREFRRILKPSGWVALIWNHRATEGPFLAGYEELLRRHLPGYLAPKHRNIGALDLPGFLDPDGYRCLTFRNSQHFDLHGLKGRTQSSSYTPPPGSPGFGPLMTDLEALFHETAVEGKVAFEYETQVHLGRLGSGSAAGST